MINDEQISSAPILILGNKIDIPGAASEDEIRHVFGLHSLTTGKVCCDRLPETEFTISLPARCLALTFILSWIAKTCCTDLVNLSMV